MKLILRSIALGAASLSLFACASNAASDDVASSNLSANSAPDKRTSFLNTVHEFLLRGQTDVIGSVIASQCTNSDGKLGSTVTANFGTKDRGPNACTRENYGPYCQVQICDTNAPPSTFQSQPVNVGKIKLHGTSQDVTLLPGADNTYAEKKYDGAIWTPGDVLAWTLTGDAPRVPPERLAQQAPIPITVTGELAAEVDRTKDYPISWTYTTPHDGTDGAQVGVFVFAFQTPSGHNPAIVSCKVPVQLGHIELPAAALAKLPPGDSGLAIQEQNEIHIERPRQDYFFQMYGESTFKEVTVK